MFPFKVELFRIFIKAKKNKNQIFKSERQEIIMNIVFPLEKPITVLNKNKNIHTKT